MEAVPIILVVVILPLFIIFHYVTKWKSMKGLTGEDEKILAELWDSAERIESRITNIERILDAENPEWRTK
jgi:phage shock protein B